MENIIKSHDTTASAREVFYGSGKGSALGQPVGDPFLQIIMQMVEGMENSETKNGEMTTVDTPENKGGLEDAFLQNIAGAINLNPQVINQIPEEVIQGLKEAMQGDASVATNIQTLQQNMLLQTGENQLIAGENTVAQETLSAEEILLNQATKDGAQMAQEVAKTGTLSTADKVQGAQVATEQIFAKDARVAKAMQAMGNVEFEVSGYENLEESKVSSTQAQSGTSQGEEFLPMERQFYKAVDVAKKQMRGQGETAVAVGEINLVKADGLDGSEKVSKTQYTMKDPQLAQQLETGIKTHLLKGDSEFTMKLKPADLGEITVKMTKIDGKLSIKIFTANAQTSQLLNNDIAALRAAVKPMQAEVYQVISVEAENNQQQMSQFNMNSQHFANQQQKSFQENKNQHSFGDEFYFEEDMKEESVPTAEDTIVKRYI